MAQPLACLYLILVSFALFLSAYFPVPASVQVARCHKFNSVAEVAPTSFFFLLFLSQDLGSQPQPPPTWQRRVRRSNKTNKQFILKTLAGWSTSLRGYRRPESGFRR